MSFSRYHLVGESPSYRLADLTMAKPTPSSMETPSSMTDTKIINHMNNDPGDCERWLLVKARNIDQINKLICHLSAVLGVNDDTALQASSCWLNGRKVKIPNEGLIVDEATGLRVFRATSSPEIYGTKAVYLAFGTRRPARTVAQQYLQPSSSRFFLWNCTYPPPRFSS